MDVSLLGVIAWWKQALVVFFMLVCVVLIVLVLLQKGRGAGLSAAFGGAGGQSAFGSKTGDVFTWITIVAAVVFLLLAMVTSVSFGPDDPDEAMATLSQPGPSSAPAGGMTPPPMQPPSTETLPPPESVPMTETVPPAAALPGASAELAGGEVTEEAPAGEGEAATEGEGE
jgi:preprotein translocase subunit SecG